MSESVQSTLLSKVPASKK